MRYSSRTRRTRAVLSCVRSRPPLAAQRCLELRCGSWALARILGVADPENREHPSKVGAHADALSAFYAEACSIDGDQPSAISAQQGGQALRDFRSLKVWEKAHPLTLAVYKATRAFPSEERYGLTRQLRRSAASVPTNIAEGCGRDSERELHRFMSIAAGSASEAEYQLLLARDLGYLPTDAYQGLHSSVTEAKRMLAGFMKKLRADS